MSAAPPRWDIFCKVIDNYGDAGVSWRLARLLAAEHGLAVTLWLDDLEPLARMAPGVDPVLAMQTAHGVRVRRLPSTPGTVDNEPEPADVVIDAFGGGLPEPYVGAMVRRARPPAWFILEYLSAEPWIEAAHGRASPHPRLPLARRFWFPGFTPRTGGLLRERGLFASRDAFAADAEAQAAFWTTLGVPPRTAGEARVSIFCYPEPVLPALLDAWATGDQAIVGVVPEGMATDALAAWAGGALPRHGAPPLVRGRLRLHVAPFLAQEDYDRLLVASDINFVRGEDSFVRAQWAARPFVWHLYPQESDVREAKLVAFLDRYAAGLDDGTERAARRLFRAWNGVPEAGPIAPAWLEFLAARTNLATHGKAWASELAALPELASGLVKVASGTL